MLANTPMTIFSVAIAFITGPLYRTSPHYSWRFVATSHRCQARGKIFLLVAPSL
jgi:hypothetical protein